MASRVVLVDDVDDVRALLRRATRSRADELEVVADAATAAEAVRLCAELDPDLVVVDLGLPDMSGEDLVRRLREVCEARIVVFTGLDVGYGQGFDEPVEGFAQKQDDVAFLIDLLANLHAQPERSAALALQMDTRAARVARAFVERWCTEWDCLGALDGAQLVASELVTNAVLHAHSNPQLLLSQRDQLLRLEVSDDSQASPTPRVPDDDDEHGRGLLIVGAYSAAWGVDPTTSGKRMWAEVRCTPVEGRT